MEVSAEDAAEIAAASAGEAAAVAAALVGRVAAAVAATRCKSISVSRPTRSVTLCFVAFFYVEWRLNISK